MRNRTFPRLKSSYSHNQENAWKYAWKLDALSFSYIDEKNTWYAVDHCSVVMNLNAVKVEFFNLENKQNDCKIRLHDRGLIYSLLEAYYGEELESALFNGP